LDEALAHGVVQPRAVIDLVAGQLTAKIGQDKDQTALLAAFREFPPAIPAAEQARLRTQAIDAYQNRFLPAWRKYRDYITGKYARAARPSAGVSGLPHGREDYAILVRLYTTTNSTPEEIHKRGLTEVDRLENEMRRVLREAGFNGSIPDYERHLEGLPEQHFHSK